MTYIKNKTIIEIHKYVGFYTTKEVHSELTLKDDLKFDELDLVELSMDLDEHFRITLAYDEFDKCETVRDIEKLVKKVLDDTHKKQRL